MQSSLLDRARQLIGPTGCAAALAIVPLAVAAARPARSQAAVLFGFDSTLTSINGVLATPPDSYNFNGTAQPDGSLQITGSVGPVGFINASGGSGGGFANLDLHFAGGITNTFNLGAVIVGATNFSASVSGGTLSFQGMSIAANDGTTSLSGNDIGSHPVFTGASFSAHDSVASGFGSGGSGGGGGSGGMGWGMDLYLQWDNFDSGTDSFTITLPTATTFGVGTAPWSQWNPGSGGSWGDSNNWQNGIPNGIGNEARLFSAGSPQAVTVDDPITLGNLRISSASAYTLSGAGSLKMQVATGSALMEVQGGAHEIDIPLTIASNTSLNIASSASLLLTAPTTINSGKALSLDGPGLSIFVGTVTNSGTFAVHSGSAILLGGGTHSGTFSVASGASLEFASGSTHNLTSTSGISGTGALLIDSAVVNSNASLISAGSLALSGTGKLLLSPGHNKAIVVNSLFFFDTAILDLSDNALIVNYGFETNHATRNAIRNLLINGRNAGPASPAPWNGAGGITSSFAHAHGNGFNLAIGYADNAVLASINAAGSYTSFGGQTVASTTILVKMTRGADCNLDGVVDGSDVSIIGTHFNQPGSGQWYFGDFDYSGLCDGNDISVLGTTFGQSSPTLPAQLTAEFGTAFTSAFESGQSGAAVPEPAETLVLGISALVIAARRRRRP